METETMIIKTIPVSCNCVLTVRIKSSGVGGVWGGNNKVNLIWCLYNILYSYLSVKLSSTSYLNYRIIPYNNSVITACRGH